MQAALTVSHRKMDYFESIAQEMGKQSHNRTTFECRSKTKLMLLENKCVVSQRIHSGSRGVGVGMGSAASSSRSSIGSSVTITL